MSILAFIILGILSGLIARALMPGRQSMGLVATAVLGMVGSFIGGGLGSLFSDRRLLDLHPSGLIGSVIGALIVLVIVSTASKRRAYS